MQKSNQQNVVFLCAVLAGLCLPLLALEWNHGHFLMDDGFILAFAWRIWNGEVPYRDFIFHKTPLTLYLHSLWLLLPDNVPYIGARFGFYLQMFLIALLPAAWALRRGYFTARLPSLALVGILFLFSFHNFPPMPWYTVDANFFSVLALVLLLMAVEKTDTRQQITLGSLSAFCCTLAFLSKQNYTPLIILFFAVFGAFSWNRHRSLRPVLPSVLVVGVTLLIPATLLVASGAWSDFFGQLLVLATGSAIHDKALGPFFVPFVNWKFLICAGMTTAFAYGSSGAKLGKHSFAIANGLAIIPFILLAYFARLFQHGTQVGFWIFWCTMTLAVSSTWAARRNSTTQERLWLIYTWGALLISIASSISYGWITPLLAAAVYGPIYAHHLERVLPPKRQGVAQHVLAITLLLFTFSIFFLSRQTNLFTEEARHTQTYNLGDIYKRLEGVYTHRQIYEDYLQMHSITAAATEKYSRAVVVMPNFPLFYFLEGTRNPTRVDWWDDGDTVPHFARLKAELSQEKPLILFQKCIGSWEEGCDPDRELIPQWVLKHSKVLLETPRFSLLALDEL